MDFTWTDIDVLMDTATDSKLASLILSRVEAARGQTEVCLCTDKASVAGLPLQITFITFPCGVAIPCAPQVESSTVMGWWVFLVL